jgi:hypothetical protein
MLHGSVEPTQISGLVNTCSGNYTLCALGRSSGKLLKYRSELHASKTTRKRVES